MLRHSLGCTLFPYTTLFRSHGRSQLTTSSLAPVLPRPRLADARRGCRPGRSEEHTSELQSRFDLVCRLLLEKKKTSSQSSWSPDCYSHGSLRLPAALS